MNALPVTDAEGARRREDMLRELNLFPLWQLRAPVASHTQIEVAAATLPVPDPVALKVEQAVARASTQDSTFPVETPKVEMPQVEMPQVEIRPVDMHRDELAKLVSNLGWAELKKKVKACTACELRAGCMQTVFGMGDENADWMFVGSWPTEDDETTGEAFAGQAGQLLDNMLAAIKLKRGSKVYLSNVVKCSGAIRRGPQAQQIAQCAPYLMRQIQLIQPKIIVALGHAAATALLGDDREWHSLLGKVHEFRGFSKHDPQFAIPLIITHHPAALLLSPLNKAQAWKDLCLARDTMQRLTDGAQQSILS